MVNDEDEDMKKSGMAFVVLFLVIFAAAFALSAFIIMLIVNIVLRHYGIRLLNYPTALAITAILSIISGVMKRSGDNKS